LNRAIRSLQCGYRSDDLEDGLASPFSAGSGDMMTILGSPRARCETRGAKQRVNMVNHWLLSLR
jgi:hypothetical protein